MITPASIAAECRVDSYGIVASRHGITRGAVAGIIRRHRYPYTPKQPARRFHPYPGEDAILDLMADGRMRVASEIAARVGLSAARVRFLLHRLVSADAAVLVQPSHGNLPAIWAESPE